MSTSKMYAIDGAYNDPRSRHSQLYVFADSEDEAKRVFKKNSPLNICSVREITDKDSVRVILRHPGRYAVIGE